MLGHMAQNNGSLYWEQTNYPLMSTEGSLK